MELNIRNSESANALSIFIEPQDERKDDCDPLLELLS